MVLTIEGLSVASFVGFAEGLSVFILDGLAVGFCNHVSKLDAS